jgi:hypothetical protein
LSLPPKWFVLQKVLYISFQSLTEFVLCEVYIGELLIPEKQLGSGHAQMLSSPILSRVAGTACHPRRLDVPDGFKWQVPVTELDNLLSLSQQLKLEGEMTPVQIWQRVWCHPQFHIVTQEKLGRLRDLLSAEVECHG